VRDNYAVGDDRILMVASDRLSAFDVVMGEPIPGKGELLTQMALFWFERLKEVVPNHLTGEAPESVVSADEVAQVRGRSMLVKRLQPIPVEAVVRGYLAGSGWAEYQQSQSVCGVSLPAGLTNASQLPEPSSAPTAELGRKQTFRARNGRIGRPLADRCATWPSAFTAGTARATRASSAKFEFGLDANGTLTLMDGCHTGSSAIGGEAGPR
jgi:phosphoribosylaminoimidazole-succinocarboxamide synthase